MKPQQNKIVLLSFELEELKLIITEAVKQELSKVLNEIRPTERTILLSQKETARLLSISLPTLRELVKDGIVPAYRIKSTIRFKENEVLDSLQLVESVKYKRNQIERKYQ